MAGVEEWTSKEDVGAGLARLTVFAVLGPVACEEKASIFQFEGIRLAAKLAPRTQDEVRKAQYA